LLVLNPDAYKLLIRPLLFNLPPETAQGVADSILKQPLLWRALSPLLRMESARLEVELAGMRLENPVGLAAGYDKDCQLLSSLSALGFGYVTAGTVTEMPRPGNPRPRILRYSQDESLVNALGFPSKGLEFAASQLEQARYETGSTPVVVSVSGVTADEIVRCHRRLEPLANAVELNISSPNTLGLRVFQEPNALSELLARINEDRRKPLFVKLPPYSSPQSMPSEGTEARDRTLRLAAACVERDVNALTVANTWPIRDSRLAVGSGGLSGRAVFPDTVRMVEEVRAEVGDEVAINACGGIFSGQDALKAIQAGATTVQILTGFIYRGPGVVRRINEQLLALMDRERVVALSR
jgi:dihydroorotate dehydrogenase